MCLVFVEDLGNIMKYAEGMLASIIYYIYYIYIMTIYTESFPKVYVCDVVSLRIQVCPKEGILPKILLPGEWDWNPQFYSREGSVFLGHG